MDVKALKKVIAWFTFYGYRFIDFFNYQTIKMGGRIFFTIKLFLKPRLFVSQKSYYPECEQKSKTRIFFEQLSFIWRKGDLNKNYFLHGWDRKSKKDLNNYVSWLEFVHERDKRTQKPSVPRYDYFNFVSIIRDKFVFEAFCKGVGIDTPSNIALINGGELFLKAQNRFFPLTVLKEMELDVFCKRNRGVGGGRDVIKLEVSNGKVILNHQPKEFAELLNLFADGNWIIQERIKDQHPDFSKFHPQCINTVRVYTINSQNKIDVFGAFMRMGVNGNHVDNWSSGGIAVGIKPEEGTLEKWGYYKSTYGTKVDKHPNSNIVFEGFKINQWEEIVNFAKKTHKLFYGIHSAGWDISYTVDGPVLIEGNILWEINFLQIYGGVRPAFNKFFKGKIPA